MDLAHRNVGRVARTNFFEVMFRGEILTSSCEEGAQTILPHPYRGMTHVSHPTVGVAPFGPNIFRPV